MHSVQEIARALLQVVLEERRSCPDRVLMHGRGQVTAARTVLC